MYLKKHSLCSLIAIVLFLSGLITACGSRVPETPTTLSFHTEAQENYLNDEYKNFMLYAKGAEELSVPEPITLTADKNGSDYVVEISEREDFGDSISCEILNGTAQVYNLKVNTTYYYRTKSDSYTGKTHSFITDSKAPRNLYVHGVTNVRDLGGWCIDDSSAVKQGMMYRSSKFNMSESDTLMITEAGIDTMVNTLGIKTEIDFRTVDDNENGGITTSPLGESVTYISLPFVSGGNILLLNRESLPALFRILGNESNYPIVFHCSIGTDRTGLVAFLINGLLGVNKDDLYRDFLFSNFGYIGSRRTPSSCQTYMDTLDLCAGASLSEKIYNYLIDSGVAAEDIDTIRRLLIQHLN